MKHTKKFNSEWSEAIALLPSEIQASLTSAIIMYQFTGAEPQGLDPIAQAMFIVIRPTIDLRARRAEYQRMRRNRKKGIMRTAPAIEPTQSRTANSSNPKAPSSLVTSTPKQDTTTESIATPKPTDMPIPRNKPNAFLKEVSRARDRHLTKRKNRVRA